MLVNCVMFWGCGFFCIVYYFLFVISIVVIIVLWMFLFMVSGVVNDVFFWFGINGFNWFNDLWGILYFVFGMIGVDIGFVFLIEGGVFGVFWWEWFVGFLVVMSVYILMVVFMIFGMFMFIFLVGL